MNTLIKFGQYKEKTYEYVMKNDIKYCEWILTQQKTSSQYMIHFQKFVKENIEDKLRNKYDINELKNKNSMNCSDLSKYMKYDKNIIDLIKDYKITINKISNEQTIEEFSLPNNIFGIFIDYLIRYEICKKKMIEFNDNRANATLSGEIITIDDKEFMLSEDIYNSYNNMKQNNVTMQDILNVSICHSFFFAEVSALKYINHNNIISNKQYDNIIKWIDMKILNKGIILCNPILGDTKLKIGADADLILDDELIDIKTSKHNQIGNNINDFIQLFVYASLYYKKYNKYINKLTIFNPLYLTEYSIEINNDITNKFLEILTNYNIGQSIREISINVSKISKKESAYFQGSDFNTEICEKYKESHPKNKLSTDIKNLIQEIELSIKMTKEEYNEFNKKMNKYDIKINDLLIKINDLLNKIKQKPINIYKTYESNKICLDIETDGADNILQIAYNIYDDNNNLIHSKDFYIYDGEHSKPVFPTIKEEDIIKYGISLKDASDIITKDINNTKNIIGHNIKSFDLRCINKLNNKFNNKIKDSLIIHDTMIGSKNIIKAKDKIGRLKNPRLDEMVMFLCNKSVENHHNALADIIATFDCYKILCDKYKCF